MFLIAEIGSNWDGDLELAMTHIQKCASAGADAVKFQLWKQEIVYPDRPEMKKYELSFEQCKKLKNLADSLGIIFICTPSYPEAVDFLESIRVPMYKIASVTSAQKHPYAKEVMEKVAKTGKPVIISYGYGDETDDVFRNNKPLVRLSCVSKYPAKLDDYIHERRFGRGSYSISDYRDLSDHTIGTSLMNWFLAKYDNPVIEKHVKVRDNSSPDSPFSLYISELADFIIISKSLFSKLG